MKEVENYAMMTTMAATRANMMMMLVVSTIQLLLQTVVVPSGTLLASSFSALSIVSSSRVAAFTNINQQNQKHHQNIAPTRPRNHDDDDSCHHPSGDFLVLCHHHTNVVLASSSSSRDQEDTVNSSTGEEEKEDVVFSIRAPLKFIGPYPCLGLEFPKLTTEAQRRRNTSKNNATTTDSATATPATAATANKNTTAAPPAVVVRGISLDFVLDTASNINTIQGPVVTELQLPQLFDAPALPGITTTGRIAGGNTYVLGDAQLETILLEDETGENEKDNDSNSINDNDDDKSDEDDVTMAGVCVEKNEDDVFMQNLTAAVLPGVANPAAAGLLGLAFFYCFNGVEFSWGKQPQQQVNDDEQPSQLIDGMLVREPAKSSSSITFYGDEDNNNDNNNNDNIDDENEGASDSATSDIKNDDKDENKNDVGNTQLQRILSTMIRVPIVPLPITQLPSVRLKINGVELLALLDTGSPITVLTERAALAAGVHTIQQPNNKQQGDDANKSNWKNPFGSVVEKFNEARERADAVSNGDILMIGGGTNLYRSKNKHVNISLLTAATTTSSHGDKNEIPFGYSSVDNEDAATNNSNTNHEDTLNTVYVGEIPGLVALKGGVDGDETVTSPDIILGIDILRKRPRMLLRARYNEVYF